MKATSRLGLVLIGTVLLLTTSYSAATITIVGENAFPPDSLFIDFTGYNGSQVDELVIKGVTFDYTYHTADRAYRVEVASPLPTA